VNQEVLRFDVKGKRILISCAAELRAQGKKYCAQCEQILPLSAFGVSNNNPDGLYQWCLECRRRRGRADYKRNKEKLRLERGRRKEQAVALFGGRCVRCGYNDFYGALVFHHVNPGEKDNTIAELIASRKFALDSERVVTELDKCILLCKNCHAGVHSGEWIPEYIKRDGVGWRLVETKRASFLAPSLPGLAQPSHTLPHQAAPCHV